MASFSIKRNDTKAATVAKRLCDFASTAVFSASNPEQLCAFLDEYGKLTYTESMGILSRLTISNTPFDMLRLAYALVHFDRDNTVLKVYDTTVKAHAKILKMSLTDADDVSRSKIVYYFLCISGPYAGTLMQYTCPIAEAAKMQKSVYTGRSKALRGRSLLELVGCYCLISIKRANIIGVSADSTIRSKNKELGNLRVKADTQCGRADTCAVCRATRKDCKLAVRW